MNKSDAKTLMRKFAAVLVQSPDFDQQDRNSIYYDLAIVLVDESRHEPCIRAAAASVERQAELERAMP